MPSPTTASRLPRWLDELLSYDCFPEFSRRVRRLAYRPLGVLLVAAGVALLCGLFVHPQGFVLAGGVLTVVALGVAWPWLSLRGLSGSLAFDRRRAAEGEAVGVRLTLRNRLPWPAWGLAVRGGLADAAAGVAVAPGRRAALCRWTITPRRGVYPDGPPRLTTGFPFGLWEAARPLAAGTPLVVWPRTFPVGPVPPVSGERQVEGNVSRREVGTGGDVVGVRPYRRGDSPRRIHWAQSARHDRLIVCELASNARPVIQLVLDADPAAHAGESREWAIRVAASFARGWLEEGATVGLAWAGGEVPPASGPAQGGKILDALAALPDGGRPLADVLACPRCRGFRDGLQVIVTTDRAHARAACGACEAGGRRWAVLRVAAFGGEPRDPAPRGWRSTRPRASPNGSAPAGGRRVMGPELVRPVRGATFALLALAAVAVEVAADDGRAVGRSVAWAAAWVAVAAALGRVLPTPPDPTRPPPPWVLLLLVGLGLGPLAAEPLRRGLTGDGHALEIQLVCGLRNVGLGLAACGGWLVCMRLACVVSLFLALFAATMTAHPAVTASLGLYAAAGSVWLTLVYWGGLAAPGRAVAVETLGRERLPWAGVVLLVLAVGGGLSLAAFGPRRAALALGEWLPTSGGTGETDPFARHGVGDGPEETAGDDAKAAGMVETDRMIEDNKDALIDAVSDLYGPPHRPREQQERTVAAGKADVIENHGPPPDNRRPSRDFDTGRKGPKGAKTPWSQRARGLFEVQGRTPLHVRAVAYDGYDAGRWAEGRPSGHALAAEGGDWMAVGRPDAGWYLADERHRLKAADLKSNLVPTPALLARLRINRVDRTDYYAWEYDGVLTLAGRRRTPPGVVVTTDCRTLDPARLPEEAFGPAAPVEADPELARLAREWAGDRPRGWPQIAAVVETLRTEYALDREAAPADHPAPALWFLRESRRGPDYLFATAAALLLRSLGYPARVCLGYYAGPEAYDPETGHTPVTDADLHVWPEVRLRDGQWLVVEPTPGYGVLPPSLPLGERLLSALLAAGRWAARNAAALAVALALLAGLGRWRRELLDAAAARLWALAPGRTWREQIRGAVAVLERRGRWAGRPRAGRQTAAAWLAAAGDDLRRLAGMAEWAAYAPDAAPPWPEAEALAECRRALAGWTLRRWREGAAA